MTGHHCLDILEIAHGGVYNYHIILVKRLHKKTATVSLQTHIPCKCNMDYNEALGINIS